MRVLVIIAIIFLSLGILAWKSFKDTRRTPYYLFDAHPADLSAPHERRLRRLGKNKELYQYRAGNIRKLIRKVNQFMEDIGCLYWVESGILLGIYHYNDVLPYDCDLDIGIYDRKPLDSFFVNRQENLIPFEKYGISLERTSHHAIGFLFRDLETDVYCDVFCYQKIGDSLRLENYYYSNPLGDWPCRGCKGGVYSIDAKTILPVQTIDAGPPGNIFVASIPNKPKECLEYIYGDLTPYYTWSEEENDYVRKG
jgi:hypothetical protein